MSDDTRTITLPAALDTVSWQLRAHIVTERVKSAPRWPDVSEVNEFDVPVRREVVLNFQMPDPHLPRETLFSYWRAEVFGWKEPLSWVLVAHRMNAESGSDGWRIHVQTHFVDTGDAQMPSQLELDSRQPENTGLILRLTALLVTPGGVLERLTQAEGLE